MARGRPLPLRFFDRDAREVAPELLGKVVVRVDEQGASTAARLVEVEAYCGAEDPAAHSYRGRTPRNATMFGPPGHLYVYLSYGVHWCANVVCGPGRTPQAVLLRAGVPLHGTEQMWARRRKARRERDLCAGPGKLAAALGIVGNDDGAALRSSHVRILDDGTPPPAEPAVSKRIGLSAGKGDEFDWRFYVPGDPNLSRP